MKQLIMIMIIIILFATNTYAWTTYPFRVGWSDVYTSDRGHEKEWNVTTIPLDLKYNKQIAYYSKAGLLTQIILVREIGKKDKITGRYSRDIFVRIGRGEEYDKTVKAQKEMADIVAPFIKKTGIVAIGYILEFQGANLFFNPKFKDNRQFFEDVIKILNKERDRKITSGKYVVDKNILKMLDSIRR